MCTTYCKILCMLSFNFFLTFLPIRLEFVTTWFYFVIKRSREGWAHLLALASIHKTVGTPVNFTLHCQKNLEHKNFINKKISLSQGLNC